MNKQVIGLSILLFLAVGGALYSQNVMGLDRAIKTGAEEIEAKLTRGVKVVVLNFRSPSQRFSDYVLDELMTELVRNGKVTVVDRANLELIRREMDFQMSGEVSDSSAQAIGQMLGAQSIVSGSIEEVGNQYRIRFRTIEVSSAAIQVLSSFNVQRDDQIASLMSGTNQQTSASASVNQRQNASQSQYDGLNFSSGRKTGAGFLNLLFGIGSFTMGDIGGGFLVGVPELAGIALMIIGAGMAEEAIYNSYYNSYYDPYYDYDTAMAEADTMSLIGAGVYIVGVIIGFARPFAYDKALARQRVTAGENSNPMNNISLIHVPTSSGMGLGVFYSKSW